MNIKQMFETRGVKLNTGMDAGKFINSVLASPLLLSKFPALSGYVSTVQDIKSTYESVVSMIDKTKQELDSAINTLESMEDALNKAKTAYEKTLQLPGAYTCNATTSTVTATPLLNNAYILIDNAQNELDTQKNEVIPEIESRIAGLEAQAASLYKSMTDKISEYISNMVTTEL